LDWLDTIASRKRAAGKTVVAVYAASNAKDKTLIRAMTCISGSQTIRRLFGTAQRFDVLSPGILAHAGLFDPKGDAQAQDKEGRRSKNSFLFHNV